MHQAILLSAHTPLTGVSTPYLHYCTPVILLLLLLFSLFGGLLLLLISGSNFLVLRFLDLKFFSPL